LRKGARGISKGLFMDPGSSPGRHSGETERSENKNPARFAKIK
jgi:hypothetical protein